MKKWGEFWKGFWSDETGGPPAEAKAAWATEAAATQGQMDIARSQADLAAKKEAKYEEDIGPLEAQMKALATGSPKEATAAIAPQLSALSQGYTASKEAIMKLPPGPAREKALADLEVQKGTSIGTAVATQVQQAPQTLAAIGSGAEQFGLAQIGAGLRGFEGATAGADLTAKSAIASNQSFLNFISGLAGSAGGIVGGSKWIKGKG